MKEAEKGDTMDLYVANGLETGVTVVSNTFIDKYMAEANGEYVKVYLYLLRRDFSGVSEGEIADALNDTEKDVRRALAYWQRLGVIERQDESGAKERSGDRTAEEADSRPAVVGETVSFAAAGRAEGREPARRDGGTGTAAGPVREGKAALESACSVLAGQEKRPACTAQEMDSLSSDADFTQLLYIAQQYLKKIFTPKDCEVFAYLYGKLRMSSELLEYLVEYCAQNNHTSLRYIEKVALSWYEKKLLTVEEAKAYSRSFSKDSFAVMKAFGLTGRSPADAEYAMLEKWYRSYGFTKELVLEACNRTMNAIHSPSFQYADRILTEWKTAGVRTMRDVEELDRLRREQQEKRATEGRKDAQKDVQKPRAGKGGRTANRFHNLEEHGYDYDKMVWNMINPGQDTKQ